MKKTLATIAVVATVISGALVVTLRTPEGEQSDTALMKRQLAAYLIARDLPATAVGMCRDVELALLADDDGDAAARGLQSTWRYCPSDATDSTLLDRKCRQSSRSLCLGSYDAGDDVGRTREERRCMDKVQEECSRAAATAGHLVWASEPYARPVDALDIDRYSRREQSATSCACPDQRDAGACRVWTPGTDASVKMGPGSLAQPGTFSGKGCQSSPCAESTLIRTAPGSEYPAICK